MKRNQKKALVLVLVFGAVAVMGAVIKSRMGGSPAGAAMYQVANVEMGEVKKTVSATGTLQPWTTVDIKSKAGGRVNSLLVEVGSVVKKGDILARIDPADTLLSVDQAQADIDSANARETQSRQTWQLQIQQSNLAIKTAQTGVATAKANLRAAQARLKTASAQKNAQPGLTNSSIAAAQANYQNALDQLNQLRQATLPQDAASAQSAYDQAAANQKNAQANLTRQKKLLEKGYVSQQAVDQAQANYDVATAQVTSAKRKLDTLEAEHQTQVKAAQARVEQAKAQLESAKASSVDIATRENSYAEAQASVAQAQQQVVSAEQELSLAKANLANIQIRAGDISQAAAQKARANAGYVNAKNTLDQTTVRAPTDGVVLQKYVEQGTIITSGLSLSSTGTNIVQLGDTTRMYVDVTVDETDVASVRNGQEVDVSFDAYPGIPFEGKVARVNPQALVEQNVTSVHVRVEIDNSSPSFKKLKPGMNATCEFIVGKRENVIRVPTDAVHEEGRDKYVEIAIGGTPASSDPTNAGAQSKTRVGVKIEKRPIKTGLEGNDNVQIVSGVQPGETIVTQTIEASSASSSSTPRSPFGGGPGGGMRGGGGGGGRR